MQQESNEGVTNDKQLSNLVISTIEECPNYTIRPSRLAAQLGISIDDASAELCGVLAAVGGGPNGASFQFERSGTDPNEPPVMVFTFPRDFQERARNFQRKESMKQTMISLALTGMKFLKVMIAFGLVLSLFILGVIAIIVMVSVLVGILTQQRGRNGNHQSRNVAYAIQRHLHTFRSLLWFYAIFGGRFGDDSENSMHPFFREVALILVNLMALCSGRGVFFPMFWFRFWRTTTMMDRFGSRFSRADSHGVTEMRRGVWYDEPSLDRQQIHQDDDSFRGLLSVLVEFLFGPSPFWPGPTDRLKWRLRAEIITSKSKGVISLEELSAFVDDPPESLEDHDKIVSSGLEVVTHFNGLPVIQDDNQNKTNEETSNSKSLFRFPELIAEADSGGLPTPKTYLSAMEDTSPANHLWYTLFYQPSYLYSSLSQGMDTRSLQEENGIPNYLHEQRLTLTKLTPKQFHSSVALGFVNYIGMSWLRSSFNSGGLLASTLKSPWLIAALKVLTSILSFYARLFFILPLVRLLVIYILNYQIDERNKRRRSICKLLEQSKSPILEEKSKKAEVLFL